ncbi:hypothetical protein AGMMS49574_24900 [Bacteroidia bacterium]|nr:hypothetical protein AGMMS49574_24900 [Bacteroidia bacterium]
MKIKITHLITALFLLCSAYSWGQTWQLTPTMTAVLNNGVLTISTTKSAEAMPDYNAYDVHDAPWFSVGSSILSVVIRDSVTSVGNYAFAAYPSIKSVTIGNSVTTIGERSFHACSGITSVTLGSSVTTLGLYAFYTCSGLTSITLPNSVTTIAQGAFNGCTGLVSITMPNSVTTIGADAFAYCSSLASITLPNSVTIIRQGAFYYCTSLASVTIPNSVTSIEEAAFKDCRNLKDVTVSWNTPLPVLTNTFENVTTSAVNLHVPAGTEALYKAAPVWKEFKIAGTVGTEGVKTSSLKAWATNGNLYVSGLHAGESLRVFNVTGQLIHKSVASDTEQQISLRNRGIYIIVARQRCIKAIY